jgi:hypothetical protein
MRRAPVVGREVVEEIWFMSILSVTSFLRVYGRTRDVSPGERRHYVPRTVLFHPDCDRRLGDRTQIC